MRKINDLRKIEAYTTMYRLQDVFSNPMNSEMELLRFEKDECICRCGEPIDYLLFLVEGKVKVYTLLQNGKSLLLCFNKPFRVMGDIEFIEDTIAHTNVQAIETVYCIGIKLQKIRQYALEDAKFLRYMCNSLARKLTRISTFSSINLLYPLENRLASYLLATTGLSNDSNDLYNKCNLTEVAELLGTSYRHLLRTFNVLKNKGAIEKQQQFYVIKNREILESLAGDLYE